MCPNIGTFSFAGFSVSGASVGEAAQAFEGLNSYGSMIAGGGGGGSTSHPKVFVTILLFDKDHQLVDATFDQIDGGEQIGATPTAHDHMMAEYEVTVPGYAYVFVSNENPTYVEAYFDDVTVTHTPTNILQYNACLPELERRQEYYPFGLQTASSWTRDLPAGQAGDNTNQFLYNAGNELNEESGWYETFYRGYDPALGRMLQVDPMVDKYASLSPYNYAFNDPVLLNDPMGDDAWGRSQWGSMNRTNYVESWKDRGALDAHAGGGGMYGGSMRSIISDLIIGKFGGTWSSTSGINLFSSKSEVLAAGFAYDKMHGSNVMGEMYGVTFEVNMTSVSASTSISGLEADVPYVSAMQNGSEIAQYDISFLDIHGETSAFDIGNYQKTSSQNYYEDPMFYINAGVGVLSTGATIKGGYLLSNEVYHYTKSSGNLHFRGGKYWNNGFVGKSKAAIVARGGAWRNLGNKLGYAGIAVTTGDALLSGEFRASQAVNIAVTGLAIGLPGVGSIIAGVYFAVDIGLQVTTGSSLGDRIDKLTGGTYEAYDGLY